MKTTFDIDAIAASANESSGGLSRRTFIRITSAGFALAAFGQATSAAEDDSRLFASAELNAFIEISTDGKVRIYSANAEMGQGIKTALPMVIAEEMGVRWEDVEVLQSPVDSAFGNQFAGGSTTVARTWDQMRQMGASAREMLISAGALVMEVPRDELTAAESRVTTPAGAIGLSDSWRLSPPSRKCRIPTR